MTVTIDRIEEHAVGVSWVVDEAMNRTSHAVLADGRVWLIDPVDHPDAMERVAALGPPAAVVQLLDRHNRDCAQIAGRLQIPHLRVPDAVDNSPFQAIPIVRMPRWRETSLWWEQERVLLVAEALGTAETFTTGHGAVGMHPVLRPRPPGGLRGYQPEHLLVGHGAPVHGDDAREGVKWAYDHARSDLVRLPLAFVRMALAQRRG